ncbi:MAG: lytic transglycosylase domain-containing protein [Spirochaetes bacterium]|nr:lytic transglycosylase domain-containing protein [Spirochaetota bacterium]MBU0956381.1 lytic transglycosylase domain-containing protein [Spirochaetota bacterium]
MAGCKPDDIHITDSSSDIYLPDQFRHFSSLSSDQFHGAMRSSGSNADYILELYDHQLTREATVEFFTAVTGSRRISDIILAEASRQKISPALAFALAYHESGFKIRAVNRNPTSIDRGLFQLNSKTFPHLQPEEFFNPERNTRLGLNHLQFCLDEGRNEVVGLAIYNAGLTRIKTGGTPLSTLNYINRILSYRDNLQLLFEAQVVAKFSTALAQANPELAASGM